uniref:Uncharacterized protein n=1 Tax=Amphora coffeiformis TaxID=265554 RepID=A0A7S3L6F8_9STRA
MTNKNKQKRSSESKAAQEEKRRALKEQAAKDAKSLEEVPEIKPQAFSKGQLNAFILIGVGIAKLFNIGKAIRMGGEPAKLCLLYFLDDDVCSDDGLNTFLRFKYMLSLQVLVTVVTIALQCWKSEDVLIRYTGSLLVPVFTTSLALVANNLVLNQRAVWYREIMMAFVVTVTTMPGKSHLPFLTGTKQQNNTVQSLVLMTFCCFTLFDAFEWGSTIFQVGSQGIAESLFNPAFFATLGSEVSPVLAVLAQFFVIDRFIMATSIFFAWYYLKESHHRTILFFLAATKVAAVFFQYPQLEDSMVLASSTKQTIEIGLAVLGFVAWGMPSMSWKTKTV